MTAVPHPPPGALLLHVTVPGRPVGAARPRVVRLQNGASHTFMPGNSVAWEALALQLARDAWAGRPPMDEAASVYVEAIIQRPQKLRRKRDPEGRIPALCKPDMDNIVKLAQDALVKAGVLVDDTRVVELRGVKLYAARDPEEQPHVGIWLWRFDGQGLGIETLPGAAAQARLFA